jgi:uncharacterized protein CbrC (UPF0167 family)
MRAFKYFEGPREDMSGLAAQDVPCEFCGRISDGFDLDLATCSLSDDGKAGKFGCAECLLHGQFEFWHDTDIGMLDEQGLEKVYKHNAEPPSDFPERALADLRRTPRIVTWQQELWLSHCNDFMVYMGTWQPADFVQKAATGDGRTLFLKMTRDPGLQFLWDECLEEGETAPATWNVTYYAFRCLHCGDLAGNWDCD